MRRAAFEAGLIQDESSDRLALALEPEAACVACEAENEALRKGHRFMMLDCGGGTVDITMHLVVEKEPQLRLDEMCRPSGGPWGSTFVDAEFEAFVRDLVGPGDFGRLKPSSQWVELMRVWEGVKLGFDPGQDLSGENCKSVNLSSVLEVSGEGGRGGETEREGGLRRRGGGGGGTPHRASLLSARTLVLSSSPLHARRRRGRSSPLQRLHPSLPGSRLHLDAHSRFDPTPRRSLRTAP